MTIRTYLDMRAASDPHVVARTLQRAGIPADVLVDNDPRYARGGLPGLGVCVLEGDVYSTYELEHGVIEVVWEPPQFEVEELRFTDGSVRHVVTSSPRSGHGLLDRPLDWRDATGVLKASKKEAKRATKKEPPVTPPSRRVRLRREV